MKDDDEKDCKLYMMVLEHCSCYFGLLEQIHNNNNNYYIGFLYNAQICHSVMLMVLQHWSVASWDVSLSAVFMIHNQHLFLQHSFEVFELFFRGDFDLLVPQTNIE